MSKRKSQIELAIDALVAKQADIATKAAADCAALESAIVTLKAQRVTRRLRPRTVAQKDQAASCAGCADRGDPLIHRVVVELTHRLNVWVTVPADDVDPDVVLTSEPDEARRIRDDGQAVERALIHALTKFEWDCDVELMDHEAVEE